MMLLTRFSLLQTLILWHFIFCKSISAIFNQNIRCTETIISFSERPEKIVFPKKLRWNMIFFYYRERWYFLFLKIWSYTLDGKWKMTFLKKYMEIWYFLQASQKDGFSKRARAATWSFLYYLERWYFFPENMIFFHRAESETRPFSGNTWKHDAQPSEENR